jgi:hypothetical protein
MVDYSDYVLKKRRVINGKEKISCHGLRKMYCVGCGKCKFYASSKDYYRDRKTGFIKERRPINNEKIYI